MSEVPLHSTNICLKGTPAHRMTKKEVAEVAGLLGATPIFEGVEKPVLLKLAHACVLVFLNPKPETPNLGPETRKLKPETPNSEPHTSNPKSEIRNPKPETRNLTPETWDPKAGTRSPKPDAKLNRALILVITISSCAFLRRHWLSQPRNKMNRRV